MKKEIAAEWVSIDKLKKWKENPRDNTAAIPKVKDSIKRFGFASPIIARKADGTIIAGHTRFEAAKLLKLEKVPVRFMDLDPADFTFYTDGFRYGAPPHAGWGLGLDRLSMIFAGAKNVRECVLFPRDRTRMTP